MGVVAVNPNFNFGQVESVETVSDGTGSFISEDKANAAETKFFKSKTVEFVAGGDDSQGSLVSWATGMPPGVGYIDEGAGKIRLEGTPTNNIIPDFPIKIYDQNTPSVSTGGTPSSYTLGDQVNVYVEYSITFFSKHKATGSITFPMFVIKDWDNEKDGLLQKVYTEYPE